MAKETHHPLIVLGSGPAGYTAAIYAGRANLAPLLIQGMQPGGQLVTTTDVDNFPGFPEGVQGPDLMQRMQTQAERFGTQVVFDTILKAELTRTPFRLEGDSGDTFTCDALIIATGASARWLGLESETRLRGFGVSACATCDGFFFRGQDIAVIGGGDTAVEEAIFLTNFATRVYLVHRRDQLRAERIMQEHLFANEKVTPVWNVAVDSFEGDPASGGLKGLRLRDVKSGEIKELAVTGAFVAIGHKPNTDLFEGQLQLDETGYILTKPGSTSTNIPGVFAAGDVQDKIYRQAITAAGTGCMAALEAERHLATHGHGVSRK
ncbi:MAG: thioredoxin-disulfide reductase [Magnetococcales bacterium]|nr:thioredoxin-disulfide reductase [Magnetococcales bacterium]